MFINAPAGFARMNNGKPTISLPFPNENIAWPLIAPRRDGGKYVMALFEGGKEADGARVHAVSTWTTPKDVCAALSKETGQEVVFNPIPEQGMIDALTQRSGAVIAKELSETMRLIGEYSYFGPGEEKNQKEHNKWMLKDAETISYPQYIKEFGPHKYE